MRARGGDAQPVLARELASEPRCEDLGLGFAMSGRPSSRLRHGLVQLGLSFPRAAVSPREDLGTCERSSRDLRVDDLELFLDPDGQSWDAACLHLDGGALSFSGQLPGQLDGSRLRARSISMSATAFRDPVEVVLADREQIAVGGRVHEVDRVRDPVAHRELDRVEVVPERAAQREAVALDPRQSFGSVGAAFAT
jgi:hypothetical protein